MASYGEEPGNAARGTAAWPTRSALIGLVGAALGVLREDRKGQVALAQAYRFVIRPLRQGALLHDFHTYQSLPSPKGHVATRAEALRHPEVVTSITRRDYRTDVSHIVAMRTMVDPAAWSLEAIGDALRRPAFALYLGRRSCPLGAPLRPVMVDAENGPEAIDKAIAKAIAKAIGEDTFEAGGHVAETPQDLGKGAATLQRRRRTDQPLDRLTWHFGARDEWVEAPK